MFSAHLVTATWAADGEDVLQIWKVAVNILSRFRGV
jgi:hypothetical protein